MGNFNQNVIKAPVAIVSIFLFTVFFGYGVINAQSDEESISRRQQQLEAELDKILFVPSGELTLPENLIPPLPIFMI